jgi:hypothetical protein
VGGAVRFPKQQDQKLGFLSVQERGAEGAHKGVKFLKFGRDPSCLLPQDQSIRKVIFI